MPKFGQNLRTKTFLETVELVLKVAWQWLLDNWGTQWVKSWGHAEKVMFSSHDPMTLPTVYPNYLKALAMLLLKQVLFSR